MFSTPAGTYWCEASNQAGSVALNFTIYVNSVIRRTDFIASNRVPVTATTDANNIENLVNKRSGIQQIAAGADDALFNELNAADQASTDQTKHQPLLNTSNSVVIGLVLGILFGILLVLAIFSILIVALCRKKTMINDQVDLMSAAAAGASSSGPNSAASTGCSTENSLLSTLAQVNCLQANNLQVCSMGHSALSASGSANDWYSTSENNFNNSALLTNNRTAPNNYANALSLVHHSGTMSGFNSTNSLSMLSSNNLYGHCNLLTGHDQLFAGHLAPHQTLINGQTGSADHCGTLNVLNLEATLEKGDLNSNALQIYDDEDLKKSKIA